MSFPELAKPTGFKVYRGAFNYFKGGNIYSEETFEVYKNRREMSYHFTSEIHSRVSTGELLSIKTNYFINKEYIPQKVIIDRSLGKEIVREEWHYVKKKDIINYYFHEKLGTTELSFTTSPRFHIATPTSVTSMLFLRSKKFDNTGKNLYTLWQSFNQWTFEKEPVSTTISVKKVSSTNENMNIDGQNVQAIQYKLFQHMEQEEEEEKYGGAPPFINAYLSKHLSIPYVIRSETDGTKIQIRYLNNLDSEIS